MPLKSISSPHPAILITRPCAPSTVFFVTLAIVVLASSISPRRPPPPISINATVNVTKGEVNEHHHPRLSRANQRHDWSLPRSFNRADAGCRAFKHVTRRRRPERRHPRAAVVDRTR